MMSRPEVQPTVERLSQQIRELQNLQDEVCKDAVYLGMTPEIAKECDERRQRIAKLTEELSVLRTDSESL